MMTLLQCLRRGALLVLLASALPAAAQTLAELQAAQREAEARQAIAEAERAELLARLPPAGAKPLAGSVDVDKFGAAGLVKAFDLARELAADVCADLPAAPLTAVYEPATAQGIVAARLVDDALGHYGSELKRQNALLRQAIDAHTPPGSRAAITVLAALTAVPATLRAAADLSALFKSNVDAQGIAYGSGARSLFVTALAQACPDKVAGLGSGYLGELDRKQLDAVLARVRALAAQRGESAALVATVQKLADAAKADDKKALAALVSSANAMLKTVDAFIDSLKAGEADEAGPLYNAARYLGYAARTQDMLVLDVDLRLEGLSIVKDNLFTGQHLRLSGVAFLWYRLHAPGGALLHARALRRITAPVDVDLRGRAVDDDFWNGR